MRTGPPRPGKLELRTGPLRPPWLPAGDVQRLWAVLGVRRTNGKTQKKEVFWYLTESPQLCNTCYMPKRKRKPMTMTRRLRVAVNASPLSFQALERETGLLRQTLMKFARGESSLRLDMADKLAEYFGLELTKRKD